MKILMTGATGFIGKKLTKSLASLGHEIYVVTRGQNKNLESLGLSVAIIEADLQKGPLNDSQLSTIDAVVHLAGENVGESRWSKERKQKIFSSRADVTRNLVNSFANCPQLKVFLSASATGYYGNRGEERLSEESSKGEGFLSDVCEAWEKPVRNLACRHVILRTGVVLASSGGAMEKILRPFRFGLGSALGSGLQWMPWIHIEDLIRLYQSAVEDEKFNGVFNAVAPEPATNRQMSQAIAKTLKKKLVPNVPAFLLKTVLGEMSSLLLDSQKVDSEKLQKLGFQFKYKNIQEAIQECCEKN